MGCRSCKTPGAWRARVAKLYLEAMARQTENSANPWLPQAHLPYLLKVGPHLVDINGASTRRHDCFIKFINSLCFICYTKYTDTSKYNTCNP
jgi:hypothetical protein